MVARKKCKSIIDEKLFDILLKNLRGGASLFSACRKAGVSTQEFYEALQHDEALFYAYRMALADYADTCTDDIRQIVADLKAGDLDNSTAKLLIETEKWLAQKACPEPLCNVITQPASQDDDAAPLKEIVVKFV